MYAEGLSMGYRRYDSLGTEPLFPFGYGLSYTTFSYSNLSVTSQVSVDVRVRFTLTNQGKRRGAEIAQVYASLPSDAGDAPKRLIGWSKVTLAPGEKRLIQVSIPAARFSVWRHEWQIPGGSATIIVGASSRDPEALTTPLRLTQRKIGGGA